ncbi:hypothetical protein DVH24_040534 [Malus domestica]|uniref:Uncharacterized protein n=1 Tax=Malus domestica TaxID=3750 RepID=A0A498IBK1_MALDO|nr:hypothetical protein DVH24_040534 [Malus domestica]
MAYKRLSYSPYCQLVWNLNFLYGIRVGCLTCEAKRPHALHITLLCCPSVRLENLPHVWGRVENESHIDGMRDLAWAYKRLGRLLPILLIGFMVEPQLSSMTSLIEFRHSARKIRLYLGFYEGLICNSSMRDTISKALVM